MIDLHLHVLPGVDDGARTDDEARQMLRHMAGAGFTKVVATPHLMEPLDDAYRHQVESSLDRLRPVASECGIELELGYEHMVDAGLARRIVDGEPSTLGGGNAVLVELPFVGWNYEADRHLFELESAGFRPVLAHPERYLEVHRDPDLVLALAARGVVLQLTFAAFAGNYGKDVRTASRILLDRALDNGAFVILATDAHGMGQRLTSVAAGVQWIERRYGNGPAVIRWATSEVPSALLSGAPIPTFDEWLAQDHGVGETKSRSHRFSLRALNPLARRPGNTSLRHRPTAPVE